MVKRMMFVEDKKKLPSVNAENVQLFCVSNVNDFLILAIWNFTVLV